MDCFLCWVVENYHQNIGVRKKVFVVTLRGTEVGIRASVFCVYPSLKD